jgi:hypothetical protein
MQNHADLDPDPQHCRKVPDALTLYCRLMKQKIGCEIRCKYRTSITKNIGLKATSKL